MAEISKVILPSNVEYDIKDTTARSTMVKKTGDTMSGNLVVPALRSANTYYGVSFGRTTSTPKETILYTGIKWVSAKHMPVVHVTGYAYGLNSPVEFKIGFYIYDDKIGYCGVTNMGAWSPSVYLFKYVRDDVNFVAIGFSGQCYFLQLQVDVQDEMGKFNNIVLDSANWSWSFLTTTGTIPTPDGGTTCIAVPYKADILNQVNIKNNTSHGALGWSSSISDAIPITSNTLAYWDGRYQATNNKSNIEYVKLGKIGTAATYTAATSVGNNSNLPTGAAIQTYVTGLGYEANQNAFSNIAVGSTTIAADAKTDTLTLVAGSNVTLTPDATNDKVTIAATDTKYTPASAVPQMDGTAAVGTSAKYAREDHIHPSDTSKVSVSGGTLHDGYLRFGIGTNGDGTQWPNAWIGSGGSTSEGTKNMVLYYKPDESTTADYVVLVTSSGEILPQLARVADVPPKNHAATSTIYGAGSTSTYGHVKLANNITTSSHTDGLALSAYQGKVLQDHIDLKATIIGGALRNGTLHFGMGSNQDTTAYPKAEIASSGGTSNRALVAIYRTSSSAYEAWDIIDKEGNFIPTKAPKSHAASDTTYGGATQDLYGHAKVINNLTTSSHTAGNALSAYQGYVLKQAVDSKLEQGDTYTPAQATASYQGLTITFVRALGTVHVTIRGTLSAEIASSNTYVTICAIPAGFRLSAKEYNLWYIMLGAVYYGQIRISSNNLQFGYTRRIGTQAAAVIPTSTALYMRFSYACDTV